MGGGLLSSPSGREQTENEACKLWNVQPHNCTNKEESGNEGPVISLTPLLDGCAIRMVPPYNSTTTGRRPVFHPVMFKSSPQAVVGCMGGDGEISELLNFPDVGAWSFGQRFFFPHPLTICPDFWCLSRFGWTRLYECGERACRWLCGRISMAHVQSFADLI